MKDLADKLLNAELEVRRANASYYELEQTADVLRARLGMAAKDLRHAVSQLNRMEARISVSDHVAFTALTELDKQGGADFLLIKDPTVRKWWEEWAKE